MTMTLVKYPPPSATGPLFGLVGVPSLWSIDQDDADSPHEAASTISPRLVTSGNYVLGGLQEPVRLYADLTSGSVGSLSTFEPVTSANLSVSSANIQEVKKGALASGTVTFLGLAGSLTTTNVFLSSDSTQASTEPRRKPVTWYRPVIRRLLHLRWLKNGWNGPGSLKIDPAVAAKALRILIAIAPGNTRLPSISPGYDGSLQLAWYTRELELEIDVPLIGNPAVSLYDRNSGDEAELTVTSPELSAAIRQLSAG